MTAENRPPIPEDIKREVRQRCGFGCVLCGLPLYEYEHMLEWSVVKRHVADEITLLCRFHHGEKTNRLLPKEVVVAANKDPWNLRQGVSKPYTLHYSGDSVECIIGDNAFTTGPGQQTLVPLMIQSEPLVMFDLADGHLLLSLNLYDERGNILLRIYKYELVYSMQPWDVTLVGRTLKLRQAERHINIEIEFAVPNKVHIRKGIFHKGGTEVLVGTDYLYVTNSGSLIGGCSMRGVQNGIVLGNPPQAGGCGIVFAGNVPPVPDRKEARSTFRRMLKEMRESKHLRNVNAAVPRTPGFRLRTLSDVAWYLVFPRRDS